MKKWMMAVALLVFTTLGVAAQQRQQRTPQTPEQRAERMTERMAEKLNLSEAQKKEVYQIHLDNAIKHQKEMEAQRAEREARKAEKKAQEEKLMKVLTEEQRKQWEEIKLEGRDQRRPGGQIHERREIRRGSRDRNNSVDK